MMGQAPTMSVLAPAGAAGGVATTRGREIAGVGVYLLFFVGLMIPDVLSFYLGDTKLPPTRIALIALMVPILIGFFRAMGRIYAFDLLYFAFCFWTALCILINRGAGGVPQTGVFLIEYGLTYLMAVAMLTSTAKLRGVAALLVCLVIALGAFGVVEAVSHKPHIADFFHKLAGYSGFSVVNEVHYRLGMLRARTVFSHPILHGVFCAAMLSFAWYLPRAFVMKAALSAGVLVASFAALSGGGFVVLLVQMVAIGVETVTRGVRNRFRIIAVVLGSFLTFVHFYADSGLYRLVQLVTLDGGSAHYRTLIWEHGVRNVERNPIFGMRPEEWTRLYWMSSSIDNYWLAQAMRGGVPSVVFFFTSVVLIIIRIFRAPPSTISPELDAMRRAWTFAIIGVILGGATVFFFDKLQPFFGFLTGIGAAVVRLVVLEERSRAAQNPAAAAAARPDRQTADKHRPPVAQPDFAAARRTAQNQPAQNQPAQHQPATATPARPRAAIGALGPRPH